ncbi:MAG: transporter permease, partial [Acidimicrobiaceae bacterium]|nr:transporter permease [Acidimicrobiaceae bacterium]
MSRGRRIARFKRTVLWGLLAVAVIAYGFPFLYLVLTSLKTPVAALQTPPQFWPSHFTFVNYTTVLRQ